MKRKIKTVFGPKRGGVKLSGSQRSRSAKFILDLACKHHSKRINVSEGLPKKRRPVRVEEMHFIKRNRL